MDIKGVVGAWEELIHWDWHIYTIDTMYKTDIQGEPAVLPRELYYMLCGDLNGKEIQERGYMYTYNWFTFLYSRN